MNPSVFSPDASHVNKIREMVSTNNTDEELYKLMNNVYIQCQKTEDEICDALIKNKLSIVDTLRYFYKEKLVSLKPKTSVSINQDRMRQIRKLMHEGQKDALEKGIIDKTEFLKSS